MTAEIVNLRLARKRKARAEKDRSAAENRVAHGVSKAERDKSQRQQVLDTRRLDGVRRIPTDDGEA